MQPTRRLLVFSLALAVAGCGDLPRPFMNNPGATATRLLRPPPARLAVPPPSEALLSDEASAAFAKDVADALVGQEVPSFAGAVQKGDWRLVLSAEAKGQSVVPTYTVFDPTGNTRGSTDGPAAPASAWAAGDASTLRAAAAGAAPGVTALLIQIEAAIQQADPNSLVNRPARIRIGAVTGAPGDGATALPRQLGLELAKIGEVVLPLDAPGGGAAADYSVTCQVNTVAEGANTVRVEIQWIVSEAGGPERGRIVQINEIPAGTLDHYWGDVAVVVTEQAAGGIREVILNQLANRRRPNGQSGGQSGEVPENGAISSTHPR